MSFIPRLRREARRSWVLALVFSVVFVPSLAAVARLSFEIHPVLSILSGLFAGASTVFAVVQARECRRLFRMLDAEEFRRLRLPII